MDLAVPELREVPLPPTARKQRCALPRPPILSLLVLNFLTKSLHFTDEIKTRLFSGLLSGAVSTSALLCLWAVLYTVTRVLLETEARSWREGSGSEYCLLFSRHPHIASQPFVTPVPRDVIPSSGFHGQSTIWSTYTHVAQTMHACKGHKNIRHKKTLVFTLLSWSSECVGFHE